nr:unnamed protein product [Callosobruchus analis]
MTKSGQAPSRRRKYIYFDKMLFLLPCMEHRDTETNVSVGDDSEHELSETQDVTGHTNEQIPTTSKRRFSATTSKIRSAKSPRYEEQLLDILQNKRTDEKDDGDVHFACR